MKEFNVGQKVVCVCDDFDPDVRTVGVRVPNRCIWPVKGFIYTISRVKYSCDSTDDWEKAFPNMKIGLVLDELNHPQGFDSRAFDDASDSLQTVDLLAAEV